MKRLTLRLPDDAAVELVAAARARGVPDTTLAIAAIRVGLGVGGRSLTDAVRRRSSPHVVAAAARERVRL